MRSTLEAGRPAWTMCAEGMGGGADATHPWSVGAARVPGGGWISGWTTPDLGLRSVLVGAGSRALLPPVAVGPQRPRQAALLTVVHPIRATQQRRPSDCPQTGPGRGAWTLCGERTAESQARFVSQSRHSTPVVVDTERGCCCQPFPSSLDTGLTVSEAYLCERVDRTARPSERGVGNLSLSSAWGASHGGQVIG